MSKQKLDYEQNVVRQMREMREECISYRAVPLLLIAIDGEHRGHMFWPDELPPELIAALPELLEDVRESLAREPIGGNKV